MIALAAAAGACFGAFNVAVRIGQRGGAGHEAVAGSIALVVVALGTALAISVAAGDRYIPSELWPFALGGAVAPGASQVMVLRAVREAGAARFALVVGAGPMLSASLAVVFLGEQLTTTILGGMLLIALGSAALARERRRPADFRAVGIAFAVGAVCLFAARDNIVRWGAVDLAPPGAAAATASLVGALVVLVAYALVSKGRGRALFVARAAVLKRYAAAGILLAVASCALYSALNEGPVSVVAPLNATQSLWTVVFAAIAIREHEAITARLLVAAVLVVAGGGVVGAAG